MRCKCGSNRFYAHQASYGPIIVVDGDNNWIEDVTKHDFEASKVYGPYTCAKCGREYQRLD